MPNENDFYIQTHFQILCDLWCLVVWLIEKPLWSLKNINISQIIYGQQFIFLTTLHLKPGKCAYWAFFSFKFRTHFQILGDVKVQSKTKIFCTEFMVKKVASKIRKICKWVWFFLFDTFSDFGWSMMLLMLLG